MGLSFSIAAGNASRLALSQARKPSRVAARSLLPLPESDGVKAATVHLGLGSEDLFDGFKPFGKIDYGLFHVFDPLQMVMQGLLQIIKLDPSRFVHHRLHLRLGSGVIDTGVSHHLIPSRRPNLNPVDHGSGTLP